VTVPDPDAVPESSAVADRVAVILDCESTGATALDGGEVGSVHAVDLDTPVEDSDGERHRSVVAKTGSTPLSVEARMLDHLRRAGLPVPRVLSASDGLLVLERVSGTTAGSLAAAAERDAARHLADLHATRPGDVSSVVGPGDPDGRTPAPGRYGFPFDTLSGPYHQPNRWRDDWPAFYAADRLGHVARAARDEGSLSPALFDRVADFLAAVDDHLPKAPPSSLCHGDVWGENLVVEDGAIRAFLDPACSYGHREVDLAYADWVGFGDAFFDAYDDHYGIDPGFRDGRRDAYALYPIVEHVRYFDADRYHEDLDRTLGRLGY
jgi:fructosamine-3-kinase